MKKVIILISVIAFISAFLLKININNENLMISNIKALAYVPPSSLCTGGCQYTGDPNDICVMCGDHCYIMIMNRGFGYTDTCLL